MKVTHCHLLLEIISDSADTFWQSLFLILSRKISAESQIDFLMVVEGKAMNCVSTSGQHRVFGSLQSSTGTLALRLVIKLEF